MVQMKHLNPRTLSSGRQIASTSTPASLLQPNPYILLFKLNPRILNFKHTKAPALAEELRARGVLHNDSEMARPITLDPSPYILNPQL